MPDIVDRATRSRMMSGIRGRNTKPELIVRSTLHRAGYRFRLHVRSLPGTPDLVLPKHRIAVFVHGCFWHGHGCHLFKVPRTRREFWLAKIRRNREVDVIAQSSLRTAGWRVVVIWECALKGKERIGPAEVLRQFSGFVDDEGSTVEIRGQVPEVHGDS